MEVYVRMNDDLEYDYAFQVQKDDTLEQKIALIFNKEKGLSRFMVLKPSIFYKNEPSGFRKSMHPGFLTENGCLLFDYSADDSEYLEDLEVSKKTVWEQLWPGQLVLPKWEKDWKTIWTFVTIMLVWLYTDLPDCISPTPGICLTNQLSKRFASLADNAGLTFVAEKLREELEINSVSVTAQWLFFVFHIVKIVILSSFFYTGLVNPVSFNPLRSLLNKKSAISNGNSELKSTLQTIGWVGARRAIYDDYRDKYYQYVIDKSGGPLHAYRKGIMKQAANPGVTLSAGEGFQTELSNRFNHNTFETMKSSGKFKLSEDYFLQLETDLKENIKACDGDVAKINAEIRNFRKYGLFECGPELTELVQLRKKVDAAPETEPLPEQEKKEQ
ncbi:Gsf2p [Kluyveromyces lactis]|uniref:KLLA0A08107p n=1 Tax=Kluyveromyces lactis (strain ATCC 8585 / CBS 2359 / DSM 70799 / NBRC 1267 / NRRL Y-1140 / WM37) TaxID=284590 RepID=Q6CXH9_KLULA|nr:uncharacterized protein KLLA0_A08107g [Kluyveromyces lactis]CAH02948.1 KLLA0A08107p [Kluyveromyces lactis]|eukprot:XP_451360.1 uncharacterized protein KLLA0_A08107g [Kluyveromyces lactis]